MFIYELLMLKIPYEGTASLTGSKINIRSHVLSGGRPPLSTKVQLLSISRIITSTSEVIVLRYKQCGPYVSHVLTNLCAKLNWQFSVSFQAHVKSLYSGHI